MNSENTEEDSAHNFSIDKTNMDRKVIIKEEVDLEFEDYNSYMESQDSDYNTDARNIKHETVYIKEEYFVEEDDISNEYIVQAEEPAGIDMLQDNEEITPGPESYLGERNEELSESFLVPDKNRNAKYLRSYKVNRYDCTICNKKFSQSATLATHMQRHVTVIQKKNTLGKKKFGQKSTLTIYKCPLCEKTFPNEYLLTEHINKCSSHACGVCGEKFCKQVDLRTHLIRHLYKCDVCSKEFDTKTSFNCHMQTHTDKRYKCAVCEKGYKSPNNLVIHMRTHTGECPFECKVCKQKFRLASQLSSHVRNQCNGNTFECKYCSKKFKLEVNLLAHQKKCDAGFICKFCNKKFYKRDAFIAHNEMHTDNEDVAEVNQPPGNSHECDVCKEKFNSELELTIHKLNHTQEKCYECRICGTKFSLSWSLKAHMRTHNEKVRKRNDEIHECDICNKQFKVQLELTIHKLNHTQEKSYKCDICKTKFSLSWSLKAHMRMHTEEGRNSLFQKVQKTNTSQ